MKTKTVSLLLAFWVAQSHSDTGEVALTMTLPENPILSTELVPLSVTITNGGSRPIPIATNEFNRVMGWQLFFEHESKRPVMLGARYPLMRRHKTIKRFPVESFTTQLHPGQSFTWTTTPYGDSDLYRAWRIEEATNITAYLWIGENEWIQSPTYQFQILPCEGEYRTESLPAYTNIVYLDFKGNRPDFCKVKLAGKNHLFTRDGIRLCELLDDEILEINRVSEEDVVLLTFPKHKKQIQYNQRLMKIEAVDDSESLKGF